MFVQRSTLCMLNGTVREGVPLRDVLYEPDPFLDRQERDGGRLLPPRGTDRGFDELLERLPWKSIG